MKKNIKTIKKTEYTLEDIDINIIKDCLNYCWHRAVKHNTPMSGKEDEINRLREQFGIINKKNILKEKRKELNDELESSDSLEELWDSIYSIFERK